MKDEIICNQEKEDGGMGRVFIPVGVGGSEGGRERDICGTAIPEFISFHFLSGRRRAGPEGALRGINNLDCTRLPFFSL